MDPIEKFLQALESEGLSGGFIKTAEKEYHLSRKENRLAINVRKAPGPAPEPEEKIETIATADRTYPTPAPARPEAQGKSRRSFKYVAFVLVFIVVAAAVVYFGIINPPSSGKGKAEKNTPLTEDKLSEQERESQYRDALTDISALIESGNYQKALTRVKETRAVQDGSELSQLEELITSKIDSQQDEDRYRFYMGMAQQAFDRDDLEEATANLEKAKEIRESPEIQELADKIAAAIIDLETDRLRDAVARFEKALKADDLPGARKHLESVRKLGTQEDIQPLTQQLERAEKEQDAYRQHYQIARQNFEAEKYEKALEHIEIAGKLKKTSELTALQTAVEKAINEKASEVERENRYNSLFEEARTNYRDGDLETALQTIRRARQIKTTPELDELQQEVLRVQRELENEKQRVEKEKRQEERFTQLLDQAQEFINQGKLSAASRKIDQASRIKRTRKLRRLEKEVEKKLADREKAEKRSVIDLPKHLIEAYHEQLRVVEVKDLPAGARVQGSLSLRVNILPDGRIAVKRTNDEGLEITPQGRYKDIKFQILKRFNGIYLAPPTDKKGRAILVENWRVAFKAGTFRGKIILNLDF